VTACVTLDNRLSALLVMAGLAVLENATLISQGAEAVRSIGNIYMSLPQDLIFPAENLQNYSL
jgi:hypothetical protein